MKTRRIGARAALGACALLVLFAAGCSLFEPHTRLTVSNATAQPVTAVYVYPVGSGSLVNLLSGQLNPTIPQGQSVTFYNYSYKYGTYTVEIWLNGIFYKDYTEVFAEANQTLTVS